MQCTIILGLHRIRLSRLCADVITSTATSIPCPRRNHRLTSKPSQNKISAQQHNLQETRHQCLPPSSAPNLQRHPQPSTICAYRLLLLCMSTDDISQEAMIGTLSFADMSELKAAEKHKHVQHVGVHSKSSSLRAHTHAGTNPTLNPHRLNLSAAQTPSHLATAWGIYL